MSRTFEAVSTVVIVAAVIIFIVGAPLLLALGVANYDCNQLEKRSGINTEWYATGGCYVEVNGKMIPQDNWRGEYQQ